ECDRADLARGLDAPVVLVVGMRLGCLNHARLSARAIAADGFRLAGWIASEVDPDMVCRDGHFELLRARLDAPCLGRLPYSPSPDPVRLGCLAAAGVGGRAGAADGFRLAGWTASELDPDMACRDGNFELLRARLDAPCRGRLPYSPSPDPARLAAALSLGA